MTLIDSSENRKKLSHIYNEIAKELFGVGTTMLKVSIDHSVITIHAKHRRSPRSNALEDEAPALKYEVDYHMSVIYKRKIRERLEQELGLSIEVVLRDYDPPTQRAITNVILHETE
ncbi:Na-translocating system protein MpsC family protein [Paenibacillus pinihumi]|uniref:Na-translocating system protein MpsC family protein n=1 Tax=Paenibacillus pinihumi TaxID=669462 RepID=UPI000409242D|nr:Na-translocating system protein MpsC family protein [Paenibacillus pinihumi]